MLQGISPFSNRQTYYIHSCVEPQNITQFDWNIKKEANNIVGTHNRSVSNGILLGTCVNSRCEQSTVCPEHVQIRGHFNISLAP